MAELPDGKGPMLVTERTPLVSGVSSGGVTQTQTKVAVYDVGSGGMTLRESVERENAGQHGLVSEGFDDTPDVVCWGYEQEAYSALARLPAIHTYTMIAFFCYFGHVWLLMQRPDLAIVIISAMLVYGICRFWIIWLSAFRGLAADMLY